MSESAAILIVEDDREIGALVGELLRRAGYEPRLARSGKELDASLARDGHPDLVLLDLTPPLENGLSICRRLRAGTAIPVLALAAHRDIGRIAALDSAVDDYLAKPFNPRELLARIRAILSVSAVVAAQDAAAARLARIAGYSAQAGSPRLLH